MEETILQYLVGHARLRGITAIIGRYIPTTKNGLVRDHFSRLGFVQTGAQEDGETTWRLSVGSYCEKNLPLKVDLPQEWKVASAGRSSRNPCHTGDAGR